MTLVLLAVVGIADLKVRLEAVPRVGPMGPIEEKGGALRPGQPVLVGIPFRSRGGAAGVRT